MTTKPVEFHPDALEEVEQAYQWYAERSVDAAHGFLRHLRSAIEFIVAMPEAWPDFYVGTRKYTLSNYPFAVVYRETSSSIQVIAVAHAKKRPGYWRERE